MRRSIPRSIGDVLEDFIRQNNFDLKLQEIAVVEYWHELMGSAMAKYTRKIYIARGVLYVEITSPVVKSELFMNREELRKRLNEYAGTEVVLKIVFR
ncbi:MAG TPA: DUF721 domain-containing protein [Prolixibacteraceae bacterium]|nr:DUF721 domain-containing protein [Prolixibacteraceae bacterium]HOR99484.1 DUF721 domain-containing protein [Prolixibacteraceae bacterium]HOS89790.1 DUF721 domain-containing protein [Prolixibacteraceae bacterium]HPL44626.1 DUF721 domain-containing protein [Prolixibacteraceae bacterium]HQE50942.1 DUF721 domain-containing protein [Prolixibacteraceae bacterium]